MRYRQGMDHKVVTHKRTGIKVDLALDRKVFGPECARQINEAILPPGAMDPEMMSSTEIALKAICTEVVRRIEAKSGMVGGSLEVATECGVELIGVEMPNGEILIY